ncbi:M20 family dipeptidase [Aspergillus clavatus NRRL 1]|uniref:Glutamate carboxypeptidase, putative n=1 Tax=Aspergillus clavatus (strain ATCC 1007 / CBS 513.65 / DSM 816 / NCTC 3887 / NRRL 1 / QM 1276 / 107) TaxID=344612 RepID=A1CN71_ASPCL|nr:glutamate carboxypeptidase, putative [Aspergillus clavatus NRRL 1]EAW07092.1 glutamate carboxypeptidase, putative [Aspergillus clavatus NRRL 1]
MSSGDLDKFFEAVDQLSTAFITRLRGAVQIQSVSADPAKRPDLETMATFLKTELQLLDASVTLHDLGDQKDTNPPLRLPPVVTAQYPKHHDSEKKTLLVYGHYDVQPKGDGHWTHEAFDLTEDHGKLFGRGSTDDKGPVCGWLNAIEAYQKAGVELPVNLMMCFEGMEEQDSSGFSDFIQGSGKDLFKNVDAICIADNYWLTTRKPCLTYGLRGIDYFTITISGPGKQLHSGIYGGTVHEPMTDLVILLSKLVDSRGNILIPGIAELVEVVTASEKELYQDIDYEMEDLYADIQSKTGAIYDNKVDTLMHRMRYPSLTIHGISGADATPDLTTSIAPEVMGKFSIRTVPNLSSDQVTQLVTDFLDGEFKKLQSPNQYQVKNVGSAPWWRTDPDDANFTAAGKATEQVYKQKPDLTREGGSIGVTLDLQNALQGKKIMLLPMGTSSDGAHGPDEKIDKENYIEGTKLFGAYFHHFATQSS